MLIFELTGEKYAFGLLADTLHGHRIWKKEYPAAENFYVHREPKFPLIVDAETVFLIHPVNNASAAMNPYVLKGIHVIYRLVFVKHGCLAAAMGALTAENNVNLLR